MCILVMTDTKVLQLRSNQDYIIMLVLGLARRVDGIDTDVEDGDYGKRTLYATLYEL